MSGGCFDYLQYRIEDIAESIERRIETNEVKPDDWEDWCGEWPGQHYSDETIKEFKEAVKSLRIAEVYAQRVDWLLSGDDGEETFHERLKKDLEELKKRDYKSERDL